LYAAVPFYQAAKKAGVKPSSVWCWMSMVTRSKRFSLRSNDGNKPSATLVLLAADMEGYSNLCQLVTLRHLGTTKLDKMPLLRKLMAGL